MEMKDTTGFSILLLGPLKGLKQIFSVMSKKFWTFTRITKIIEYDIGVLISQKKKQKRPPFRVMVNTTKPNRNEATS